MLSPFVNISPVLASSLAESTLLTANERLAREHRRAYALYRKALGDPSWKTPDIVSLRSFFLRAYGQLQLDDPSAHLPVIDQATLINYICGLRPGTSSHLVSNFLSAFETITAYGILPEDLEAFHTSSHFFVDWAKGLKAELEGNFVLPGEIPRYLVERRILPETDLITATLEHLTPAEASYFAQAITHRAVSRLDSNGRPHQVAHVHDLLDQPAEAKTAIAVQAAPTFQSELTAAANWARQLAEAHPQRRIGIVVPSLAQDHALVSHIIGSVLNKGRSSSSDAAYFDISGGEPLAATAVWQAARLLLKLIYERVSQAELLRLATSGFFGELGLDNILKRWPASLRPEVNVVDLRNVLQPGRLLELVAQHATTARSFAMWLRHFADILAQCGWPNTNTIGSRQYQAHQALIETLCEPVLSAVSAANERTLTVREALQRLDIRLERQVFAPEREPANLLVLGTLEANGLEFDHLWVCSLDEENFPSRNTGIPFLPRNLLRAHGIPRADQAAELAFSLRLFWRWQQQAKELRVSYCRKSDSAERGRSPVLASGDEIALNPVTPPSWRSAQKPLEPYSDNFGLPLTLAHSRGGVALLQDQAACPFRAYAIHRLGIDRPEQSFDLPDALTRGIVLHDALYALFTTARTRAEIFELEVGDIQNAIRQALNKLKQTLPHHFQAYEIERLTQLITSWLDIETLRDEFEIHALESSYEIQFGQLAITVRADRIDRVARSGRLIVIDYKTGNVTTSNLTEKPLVKPQLPVYSLVDPEVHGAFYASIRAEGNRFTGISAAESEPGNARQLKLTQSWSDQISSWREELERLAEEFADGNAIVAPTTKACDYCHLDAFCRIFEQSNERTDR